jgi:uncharacterized membrane protein (UPF0127 family)
MGVTARTAALLAVAAIVACALPGGPERGAARAAAVVVVPAGAQRPGTTLPVVFAEVASTPEARRLGLGGRDSLPADGGMLFVYPLDEPRLFWMKDCRFALDIAFIGRDRKVLSVATLGPGADLPNERIPSVRCPQPAGFVLETNAGWLAAHGVREGDEVDLAAAVLGVVPR